MIVIVIPIGRISTAIAVEVAMGIIGTAAAVVGVLLMGTLIAGGPVAPAVIFRGATIAVMAPAGGTPLGTARDITSSDTIRRLQSSGLFWRNTSNSSGRSWLAPRMR